MSELTEKWYVNTYHDHIKAAGAEGLPLEDTRAALAEQYAQAVENGHLERGDDLDEGRRLFDQIIGHERRSRSRSMKRSMEQMIDALAGATVLEGNDPLLDMAYPLGQADGRDKALRYWNRDDWTGAQLERYDGAARQTAAAQEFAVLAGSIISALAEQSAALTGDLFGGMA